LLAPFVCGTLAVYNWHWGFAAAGVGMLLGVIQYVLGYGNLRGVGEPPVDYFAPSQSKPQESSAYIVQMVVLIVLTVLAIIVLSSFAGSFFPSWVGKDDTVFNLFGLAFNFSIGIKYVLMPVVLVAGLIAVFLTG